METKLYCAGDYNPKSKEVIEAYFAVANSFTKKTPIKAIMMPYGFEIVIKGVRAKGNPGDWLIQNSTGDLYPCDVEVFKETYVEIK